MLEMKGLPVVLETILHIFIDLEMYYIKILIWSLEN